MAIETCAWYGVIGGENFEFDISCGMLGCSQQTLTAKIGDIVPSTIGANLKITNFRSPHVDVKTV
jgi:hypothetical protein